VALYKTDTCPFHSYKESLTHFTRAIYQLRQTDGRCSSNTPSARCGFFDPKRLYSTPGEESYTIAMNGKTNINGNIRSSFGVDLIKLSAAPTLEGKSVKILFKSASNPDHTYNVELWGGSDKPIASIQTGPATPVMEVANLDVEALSHMDLVITRTDTNEDVLQPGQYAIQVIVN
jgi:hypothetical protein